MSSSTEYARPWSAAGVVRWSSVIAPTTIHGRLAPVSTLPATTTASQGATHMTAPAAAVAIPSVHNRSSPTRASRGAAANPAATAPPPWHAISTPRKEAGRCRPSSTTANITDSESPNAVIESADPASSSRSCREPPANANPSRTSAATRRTPRRTARTGSATRTDAITAAAARNVAASHTATAAPPSQAKIAAPASGASSRRPSPAVLSTAFAGPSRRSGSSAGRSADCPAPRTANAVPCTAITA